MSGGTRMEVKKGSNGCLPESSLEWPRESLVESGSAGQQVFQRSGNGLEMLDRQQMHH